MKIFSSSCQASAILKNEKLRHLHHFCVIVFKVVKVNTMIFILARVGNRLRLAPWPEKRNAPTFREKSKKINSQEGENFICLIYQIYPLCRLVHYYLRPRISVPIVCRCWAIQILLKLATDPIPIAVPQALQQLDFFVGPLARSQREQAKVVWIQLGKWLKKKVAKSFVQFLEGI